MQLLDAIQAHARDHGRSIAVHQLDAPADRHITYAQLAQRMQAAANDFRQLLPPGAVLLQCVSNRPEFWVAFYGALAAGLSVFTVSADLAQAELDRAASSAAAAALLLETASPLLPPAGYSPAPLPSLGSDLQLCLHATRRQTQPGPGLMLASSGSTGMPKIAWRSAPSLDAMAAALHQTISFAPGQFVLTGVPMCHSYGCEHGVLGPAFGGASILCCNGINLGIIADQLRNQRVHLIPGVPFLYEILAQASDLPPGRGALRSVYSAGAPLPRAVHDAFASRFGIGIGQVYGATELGSLTYNDASATNFDPASAGRFLPGVQCHILSAAAPSLDHPLPPDTEGHLAIRSDFMLSHAVSGEAEWVPSASGQKDFLLSGDLGRLSSAGRLTLTGRLRLLIDIAGRKVNPIEVESVLKQHPAVAECIIVAVPVSQTVNRLKAIITLRNPAATLDTDQIRHFARQQLSGYKIPRMIEVRPSLPRSPLGKILRHKIDSGAPA